MGSDSGPQPGVVGGEDSEASGQGVGGPSAASAHRALSLRPKNQMPVVGGWNGTTAMF
ncbi:hypothetical protein ACI2LI_22705 [[Kitasatospora] papulosa]|uniref:hypothetical protein n=1 Tax=[Kitasatospora] papulosa TaxID=1464011 RepID=UPI00384A7DF3